MKGLQKQLGQYSPTSIEEISYKQRMLYLLEDSKERAFIRENLNAHFTASAWILSSDKSKVLLLHHTKLDKWLQPGGHADGEFDLLKVALKETQEETGLVDLQLLTPEIFDIDIHIIPQREEVPEHEHFDVRFAFNTKNEGEIQINNESKAYKWIKLQEINQITQEQSILRMQQKSKTL
ncbi:NUDIX hydrolase [Marivirga atlantica]